MKPCTTKTLILTTFTVLALAMAVTAAPVNFSEVSLWVRARETDQSIVREVTQRKLARALTPQEESTLKAQGASDSLVQSLKNPRVISAETNTAPSDSKAPATRPAPASDSDRDSLADNLQVFEVTAGHPINLSQWGGPDYEFAFNILRYAGENIIEPVMVDTVRTYTDVAHYVGVLGTGPRTTLPYFRSARLIPYRGGDLKDDSYLIGDYISVSSHSASRGMTIDKRNPVFIKGVPYTLYPIYGAGSTALYYIGHGTNSVKLAVAASRR
jgi:hypothetical protein